MAVTYLSIPGITHPLVTVFRRDVFLCKHGTPTLRSTTPFTSNAGVFLCDLVSVGLALPNQSWVKINIPKSEPWDSTKVKGHLKKDALKKAMFILFYIFLVWIFNFGINVDAQLFCCVGHGQHLMICEAGPSQQEILLWNTRGVRIKYLKTYSRRLCDVPFLLFQWHFNQPSTCRILEICHISKA